MAGAARLGAGAGIGANLVGFPEVRRSVVARV
jgi:hypothetical protein